MYGTSISTANVIPSLWNTLDKCSRESLAVVGQVVMETLLALEDLKKGYDGWESVDDLP